MLTVTAGGGRQVQVVTAAEQALHAGRPAAAGRGPCKLGLARAQSPPDMSWGLLGCSWGEDMPVDMVVASNMIYGSYELCSVCRVGIVILHFLGTVLCIGVLGLSWTSLCEGCVGSHQEVLDTSVG